MRKVFQAVWTLLTGNWKLKLLALAIAILLYHALKPTDRNRHNEHDRSFFQTR